MDYDDLVKRLRDPEQWPSCWPADCADAIEALRRERDEAVRSERQTFKDAYKAAIEAQAERDAANALLREAVEVLEMVVKALAESEEGPRIDEARDTLAKIRERVGG